MIIKLIQDWDRGSHLHRAGASVEVSPEEAEALISQGIAKKPARAKRKKSDDQMGPGSKSDSSAS